MQCLVFLALVLGHFVNGWEIPFASHTYESFLNDLAGQDESMLLTTPEIVSRNNYTSETHTVETSDGYILTMYRMTNSEEREMKPVVLLMHCIIASSSLWVMYGRTNSLAYKLLDEGFDVWLGNARGNIYSRAHRTLDVESPEYWDFSWHEIGVYDLPAMIDYILNITGNTQLQYIGFSMGTTTFYVMLSERPEYNAKVKLMQGWGPVAIMAHVDSPSVSQIANYIDQIENFFNFVGVYEYSTTNKFISTIVDMACFNNADIYLPNLCTKAMVQLFRIDPTIYPPMTLPGLFVQLPAGSSIKVLLHYGQIVKNRRFAKYDYGPLKNQKKYGQIAPPEYNLSRITVPVISYCSLHDNMATVADCRELSTYIRHHEMIEIKTPNFNHLSYIIGPNIEQILHRNVVVLAKEFEENKHQVL